MSSGQRVWGGSSPFHRGSWEPESLDGQGKVAEGWILPPLQASGGTGLPGAACSSEPAGALQGWSAGWEHGCPACRGSVWLKPRPLETVFCSGRAAQESARCVRETFTPQLEARVTPCQGAHARGHRHVREPGIAHGPLL